MKTIGSFSYSESLDIIIPIPYHQNFDRGFLLQVIYKFSLFCRICIAYNFYRIYDEFLKLFICRVVINNCFVNSIFAYYIDFFLGIHILNEEILKILKRNQLFGLYLTIPMLCEFDNIFFRRAKKFKFAIQILLEF